MNQDLQASISEYIKKIFLAYDKNHDSFLEKAELKQLLADSLGMPANDITEDQLNWHFEKIDENHDGKITFSEYFNHFFGQRAEKCRSKNNEDELIDIDQFRVMLEDTFKPLNITITQEMVEWNFNHIDTDSSGRITFEEYMKFIRKYNQ